ARVNSYIADLHSRQKDSAGWFESQARSVSIIWDALDRDYANASLVADLNEYRKSLETHQTELDAQAKEGDESTQSVGSQDAVQPAPNQAGSNNEQRAPKGGGAQAKLLAKKVKELHDRTDPVELLKQNDQTSWSVPPLFPGAWRVLSARKQTDKAQSDFEKA